ncbi:hypothetical protein GCM10023205_00990 [Yinghuangia aomiensis]|uniref:Uncharacterized protein n=2 Tax=Yinghuangia aomiensis TaxID=676205 RepID=A0ABP9GSB7_9ACTN
MDIEHMTTFENEIKKVIDALKQGPMGAEKPTGEPLKAGTLGTGFDEVTRVESSLGRVHAELDRLARVVHGQIEAMRLTVKMATDKTQEADEANRAQLSRILGEIQRYSVPPGLTPARPAVSSAAPDSTRGLG